MLIMGATACACAVEDVKLALTCEGGAYTIEITISIITTTIITIIIIIITIITTIIIIIIILYPVQCKNLPSFRQLSLHSSEALLLKLLMLLLMLMLMLMLMLLLLVVVHVLLHVSVPPSSLQLVPTPLPPLPNEQVPSPYRKLEPQTSNNFLSQMPYPRGRKLYRLGGDVQNNTLTRDNVEARRPETAGENKVPELYQSSLAPFKR
jgi:hypothetical protein